MEKKIELKFNKTMVALAGFPFGQETFKTQVEISVTNPCESVEIHFPDSIIRIASSFVQGFFDSWLNEYGIEIIRSNVTITSANERIPNQVLENLY